MDGIDSRPKTFGEVLAQDTAKRLLTQALKTGKLSRAYVFGGPRSIGKTTLASLFSRALLCEERDPETQDPCNKCSSCLNFLRDNHHSYTEVDAARYGTKESVNSLLETLDFVSVGMRVILLDEAHMISKAGKDAALRSLERPVADDGTVFLFCTTEMNKMPGTLKSRCVPVPLSLPSPKDVEGKLVTICEKNGVAYDSGSLRALAEWSGGHFREAENALEPLVLMGGINYENVAAITAHDVDAVSSMLVSLNGDLAGALTQLESLCHRFGADNTQSSILRVLLEALQYGLSGMNRDTFESVKGVYSSYGNKLGQILSHFTAKGKFTDSRLLQAEIVQTYYKFIKGDFDISTQVNKAEPSTTVTANDDVKTAKALPGKGADRLKALREMKMKSRGQTATTKSVDNVSKHWGEEEVPSAVGFNRS